MKAPAPLPGEEGFVGPPHIIGCDLCGKSCRNPEQTTSGLWVCWRCERKVTLVKVDPVSYRPKLEGEKCFLCHDNQRVYNHFLGDPNKNTVLCCERCREKVLPHQKDGWSRVRLLMAYQNPEMAVPWRYKPTIRQLNAARLEKIKMRKERKSF